MAFMAMDRKRKRKVKSTLGAACLAVGFGFALAALAHEGMTWSLIFYGMAILASVISYRYLRKPGGHVVLVYHSVSEDQGWLPWSDQIAVTPQTLDRHIGFLKRRGFTFISTADFVARRVAGKPLPANALVLHFDDGYLDNWVAAWPIIQRHAIPATIFVSLDFVEEGSEQRPTLADNGTNFSRREQLRWSGYMNWTEIEALDQTQLIDIQPHGVDHARHAIKPDVVDTIKPENWRALAWLQWQKMPGNKSGWWKSLDPPILGYGTAVPASAPVLATRAWLGDRFESQDAYESRLRSTFRLCQEAFCERLGKQPHVFCWPENATSTVARRIAAEEGFVATTGGGGENRTEENPAVISRLHAGDRVLGFHNDLADLIYLYAGIRCFQGYYSWYFVLLPFIVTRRGVEILKRMILQGRVF